MTLPYLPVSIDGDDWRRLVTPLRADTVRVDITASKDFDNIRGDIAVDDLTIRSLDGAVTTVGTPRPSPTARPDPGIGSWSLCRHFNKSHIQNKKNIPNY